MSKKTNVIVVAHPDCGAGNDPEPFFLTSLAKEVMFLVALVSLSVCLSVDNITQKVMNRLG